MQGKTEEAYNWYQQSIALAQKANVPTFEAQSLWGLGNMAVAAGEWAAAKRYYVQSRAHGVLAGGLGWVSLGLGEWAEARDHFRKNLHSMFRRGIKPVGLDALVGYAHLLAHSGDFARALELLALVKHHPASSYEIKVKVRQLWEELTAELPADLIEEAEARGRALDLFATAEALLVDSGES